MTDWFGLLDSMTDVVRDTFGEPFTYTRLETGEVITGKGVFDPAHEPLEAGASLTVAGRITVLEIKLEDLDFDPAKKDAVTVAGKNWTVAERWPNSAGTMKLQLRRA